MQSHSDGRSQLRAGMPIAGASSGVHSGREKAAITQLILLLGRQ
jgi:hypothetical protein